MKLPAAGELDRLVVIQRKATVADPEYVAPDSQFGTEKPVWLPLVRTADSPQVAAQVWAKKRDALASRGEDVRMGAEVSVGRTTWTIRYRNDVDSGMRLIEVENGEIYQIVGPPSELGRRAFLDLPCEKSSTE